VDVEELDMPIDRPSEERFEARLAALTEYAALRARKLRGEQQPGDVPRRVALQEVLERTGGVPDALYWPRARG